MKRCDNCERPWCFCQCENCQGCGLAFAPELLHDCGECGQAFCAECIVATRLSDTIFSSLYHCQRCHAQQKAA